MKTACYLFIGLWFFSSCSSSEAGKIKTETETYFSADSSLIKDSIYKSINTYSWKNKVEYENALINRIEAPKGFKRIMLGENSFACWLRFIPLKEGKPDVKLYNGILKSNQSVHIAVIDIDVGAADLQQCADAVMRLRAEYLYSQKKYSQIHFNYTSGDEISFTKWCKGFRPVVTNNKVSWSKSQKADSSYQSFRKYMNTIFMYAGTLSLYKEMKNVSNLNDILPGDVFIVGGSPGHAVTVMDVASNEKGEKIFLLAQSYMPAQDIHILVNPNNSLFSPWYALKEIGAELVTPEWTFTNKQLMRF